VDECKPLATGAFLVVARNYTRFAARYPDLVAASPEKVLRASFDFNLSPKVGWCMSTLSNQS
jgi:hypothetical protein